MRRSGPSDRTGPESSRGRLEPAAVHDLPTDAQLAVRWQLSRGTLANQRSQGRGPAYLDWPAGSDTDSPISKPTNRPAS